MSPLTPLKPKRAAAQACTNDTTLRVLLFLIAMVVLWSVLMMISHRAPDLDGMEELVWASSLELGYTKHPPFPSWIMYALTQVFGRPIGLTFFTAQVFSALGLWFVWLLAREITTPKKAFIVILLVSTTAYFSLRGTIYNHNTTQLWSIAAATWLFYRALRYQKTSSWLWLGAVSAIAMQTKYSALIQFAAFFVFMVRNGSLRKASTWKGILCACISFLVVIGPHVYWLWLHDFQPLLYADKSLETATRLEALGHVWAFLVDQLARMAPMLLVWFAWIYWNRRSPVITPRSATYQSNDTDQHPYGENFGDFNRSFVLWVGLTPLLSTVLISLLLGTSLVASWASTFFILYGFYIMWRLYGPEQINLKRIAILVLFMHLLLAVGYALARGPLAWYSGRDTRSMFPGPEISAAMTAIWHEHTPTIPLQLVVADTWLGGNIAVHAGKQAQVLINADFKESPWLNPETALDCGALVVYSRQLKGDPPAAVSRLMEQATQQGRLDIPWSRPSSRLIDLNWGLILPTSSCKLTIDK